MIDQKFINNCTELSNSDPGIPLYILPYNGNFPSSWNDNFYENMFKFYKLCYCYKNKKSITYSLNNLKKKYSDPSKIPKKLLKQDDFFYDYENNINFFELLILFIIFCIFLRIIYSLFKK